MRLASTIAVSLIALSLSASIDLRLAVANDGAKCGTDYDGIYYCTIDGRTAKVLDKDFNDDVFRCLRPADTGAKIADCTKALDAKVSPRETVIVYSERADAYLHAGDVDRAISDFETLTQLDPAPEHFSRRGDAYFKKGEYKLALADYGKAMKEDIRNPIYQVARSQAYSALKEWDGAIADLKGAIRLDPNRPRYYEMLGDAYIEAEKFDDAVKTYSILIEKKKDADSHISRALAYMRLYDADNVIADGSAAIELDPSNSFAWAIRGLAYLKKSQSRLLPYLATTDCTQSVEDLTEAMRLAPDEIAPYRARAQSYECLGKKSAAADDWHRIISVDPKNAEALAGLTRLKVD